MERPLEAGFTTVRDVGNAGDYADRDLEKAIRFGLVPGPTQPAKKLHAEYVERLRRAYKAGVMLVYGTDLSVDLPGESRGALASGYVDSYTEAGVPAKVILQAMTANAARLLQVAKQRGAIRPASPPTSWPPR